MESVEGDAFTEVLKTAKGKLVRADFSVVELDEISRRLRWSQQIEDSPFARLLESAETEVQLESDGSGTEVTIELRQESLAVGWAAGFIRGWAVTWFSEPRRPRWKRRSMGSSGSARALRQRARSGRRGTSRIRVMKQDPSHD